MAADDDVPITRGLGFLAVNNSSQDTKKMAAEDDIPITRELCRSVMPTGFAVIAFLLAFIGSVQCNAIKFTSTSGFNDPVTIQFGFWAHEDVSFYYNTEGTYYMILSCAGYSSDVDIDTKWRAAAAFSLVALILGAIDFIGMCIARCTSNHLFDCILFLLACFFQGLSLLFLDSNACKNNSVIQEISDTTFREDVTFPDTCSISTGAKCIIAATVFWGLAAFASADAYRAKRQKEDEQTGLEEPLTEPLMVGEAL